MQKKQAGTIFIFTEKEKMCPHYLQLHGATITWQCQNSLTRNLEKDIKMKNTQADVIYISEQTR